MSNIENRLANVQQQIQDCAIASDRDPDSITLLAVSKKHPASSIAEMYALGQRAFGENYLQEALEKMEALASLDIEWHFIGPIQSNKTRAIAEHFAWVHSIDREKIARRLNEQRPDHAGPLNVCIQVNIDNEASKAGVLPDQLPALAQQIQSMRNLRLRGLMAIPSKTDALQGEKNAFERLAQCLATLKRHDAMLDTLSMGMSGDLAPAIAAGATIVRIGTALFGPREA